MTYVYVYLGIGGVVLAAMLAERYLTEPTGAALVMAYHKPATALAYPLWMRILSDWGIPLIAGMAVVIGWPAAVYFLVRSLVERRRCAERPEPEEFAVAREHLVERLTVAQIEAREMVSDPLGAVPALAFGHLNAVWVEFVSKLRAGDEIWAFTAQWRSRWIGDEVRSGYVVTTDGVPGAYLITANRQIAD